MLLVAVSIFDPESLQSYRSWGRLQGPKNICAENASVCYGKVWQFTAVLATLAFLDPELCEGAA
jgi:hypothetical protein